MKKMMILALALGLNGAAWAQTMKIHTGAVTVAVPAAEAGNMAYGNGGTSLTIMGRTYQVAEIDSITVDRSLVAPASVEVNYKGGSAHVLVAGDVAPELTVKALGADVSVVAGPGLQKEVFYTLKGNSADGSFFMDGDFKARVTLENLTLENVDGPAIDIANGKRIDIVVPEGTTNRLSDGKGTHKACFFVNGHPEFEGGGVLLLTGNMKHAFASDEYTRLKPGFGTLKVLKAEGDGLHIGQYFKMEGGNVDIKNTKGDCVDVEVTKDALDQNNGEVFILNGTLKMEVAADDVKGLASDSHMTISGGHIVAGVSGLGTKGLSVGGNLLVEQNTAVKTTITMAVTGDTYMPDDPVLKSKCRGIKVKGNFVLNGGTIDISATGKKGVSVDGSFTKNGGSINCPVL